MRETTFYFFVNIFLVVFGNVFMRGSENSRQNNIQRSIRMNGFTVYCNRTGWQLGGVATWHITDAYLITKNTVM